MHRDDSQFLFLHALFKLKLVTCLPSVTRLLICYHTSLEKMSNCHLHQMLQAKWAFFLDNNFMALRTSSIQS